MTLALPDQYRRGGAGTALAESPPQDWESTSYRSLASHAHSLTHRLPTWPPSVTLTAAVESRTVGRVSGDLRPTPNLERTPACPSPVLADSGDVFAEIVITIPPPSSSSALWYPPFLCSPSVRYIQQNGQLLFLLLGSVVADASAEFSFPVLRRLQCLLQTHRAHLPP